MKKHFQPGQRVRVRSEDREHGGKKGTVQGFENQFGYRVVCVKLDDVPKPVKFAFNELI